MRSATVAEFYSDWFKVKKRELRRSTLHNYESSFRLHLLPAIGHLPLDAVKVRHVEAVLLSMCEEGKVTTAKNTKAALRSMYADAIRWDEASINPASLARLPRNVEHARQVQEVPTLQDARILHYWSWAAATTGMRWGELAALTLADVDPRSSTITVDKALYRGRLGPPKSPASVRTLVYLPEGEEFWSGVVEGEPGLCFPTPRGYWWTYSNFRQREWLPATELTGITRWTPHDFRHTYATVLIERDIPVPLIAKMLGHSSPEVTMRVYAGFFDDAPQRVNSILRDTGSLASEV